MLTFERPAERRRKVTVIERPHQCSTLCATTYQAARTRRNTTITNTFNSQNDTTTAMSTSEDAESSDEVGKIVPLRRKSRFQFRRSETKKLVEGRWKLVGSRNFEEYLTSLGAGLHCPHDDESRHGDDRPAGGGQAVEARHGDADQGQVCTRLQVGGP